MFARAPANRNMPPSPLSLGTGYMSAARALHSVLLIFRTPLMIIEVPPPACYRVIIIDEAGRVVWHPACVSATKNGCAMAKSDGAGKISGVPGTML